MSHEPNGYPPGDNYLNRTKGFLSWITTLDHKRIGVMYLCSVLFFFLVGGTFAIMLRTELLTPKSTTQMPQDTNYKGQHEDFPQKFLFEKDTYNQLFTLHGAIMVFLVIIPSIPASLGNIILPIMLGAKDVAFPRLNLWSYYLYIGGTICFLVTLATTGLDTGWTFYTPYSSSVEYSHTNVIMATMGAFILGFSSIFTGLNFLVTIHTMRPAGMTWFRMPLFLWALYATSIIQVLATPVLGITLLMLIVERAFSIGIFDPKLGGDPVLFQHFFWFYSHPAVYIMIVPGMGVASELITTFSRKTIFGYRQIALSSVGLALIGFLVWGHHLFTSTQSNIANMIFSFLTFFVAIPSAIKVFNWLATLYKGSISFQTPMLYGLAFIILFTIGGLTGIFHATLSTSIHLHDTYFVVAHFHYVMMGSALIAFIGGIFYWWPKFTGKLYSDNLGRIAAVIIFIGFNGTFFPQFVMGAKGMPRRYQNYYAEYQPYHRASTYGSYFMATGFVLAGFTLLQSLVRGKKAPPNPWGGATLEWQTPSPPPTENFYHTPVIDDQPYNYDRQTYLGPEKGWRDDHYAHEWEDMVAHHDIAGTGNGNGQTNGNGH
ncbi:MAG TPA: cbb3-type cytochrome c oxidase subunit I [Gemmatales bacterium]|nr:cbb3-type cytochrome c oxidase subunit I [Gemmatales bacterium]